MSKYVPGRKPRLADDVMATTERVAGKLRTPVAGSDVCQQCFGLWDTTKYSECRCLGWPPFLDALVPISYELGTSPFHRALRNYKDGPADPRYLQSLHAVLRRFLWLHLEDIAAATGVDRFDRTCVVPSRTQARDDARGGLRKITANAVVYRNTQYERLLAPRPEAEGYKPHWWESNRFRCGKDLQDENVLLVEDTWTSGANALGAAQALKSAGAAKVVCVCLGRYLDPGFPAGSELNGQALFDRCPPFSWDRLVVGRPR